MSHSKLSMSDSLLTKKEIAMKVADMIHSQQTAEEKRKNQDFEHFKAWLKNLDIELTPAEEESIRLMFDYNMLTFEEFEEAIGYFEYNDFMDAWFDGKVN